MDLTASRLNTCLKPRGFRGRHTQLRRSNSAWCPRNFLTMRYHHSEKPTSGLKLRPTAADLFSRLQGFHRRIILEPNCSRRASAEIDAVTRTEFEQFRDLPGKIIESDINFLVKKNHASLRAAERIPIINDLGLEATLNIHYNPEVDSKVFTIVVAEANGPICRLCVDNGPHPPCMHSHKHALRTPDCPRNNLKLDVTDKPELDGLPLAEVLRVFCELTNIPHTGKFCSPD
jgi:hypothetical protein